MKMRQRIWLFWGLALALVPVLLVPEALAAPVRLDPDFGAGGIARTPLPPAYDNEPFKEIAAVPGGGVIARVGYFSSGDINRYGPDGSLLGEETREEAVVLQPPEAVTAEGLRLVGVVLPDETHSAVTRYTPGGALDTLFGSGGTSEALPFSVEAVSALPSGKVLAAGAGVYSRGGTKTPPVDQVFVARLGADGKLDPDFGQRGIVKLRSEEEVKSETAFFVQGRPGEGAEVVTGSTVIALNPSGDRDGSFGKDGEVAPLGQVVGAGAGANEGLLVAGIKPRAPVPKGAQGPEEFYVARYTAAGKLDLTYANGSGIAALAPPGEAQASAALFEPDGRVLIGGLVEPRSAGCPHGYRCDRTPAVVRFSPDGRPDAGFGRGGMVLLSPLAARIGSPSYLFGVEALAARPGGGVFAAGEAEHAAFVAALGGDGSIVGDFGAGGIVTKSSPQTAQTRPNATGVDGSGRIFVVAQTNSGMWLSDGVVVLRYTPNGDLDHEFGEDGAAFVPPGAQSLAVAPDGSTFLTSASESTLTKLTPEGVLDPRFGTDGSVVISPSRPSFTPWAVVRLPDGDLLVGGSLGSKRHGPRPAVYRYRPDGKLDRSFGKQSKAVVQPGRGRLWEVRTMTVDPQGRIVLAGSASRRHRCCTQAGMLIRLDKRGLLDRSFGHGGGVLIGRGAGNGIQGLASRGNQILAVTTSEYGSPTANLLYSFRPDGQLDHTFGDQGVARARLSPHGKRNDFGEEESAAVFSTPRRILVVRAGDYAPLVSFSPRGHLERNFARHLQGLVPGRQTAGPFAALAGSSLILAWPGVPTQTSDHGDPSEVNLQRLRLP
ncbi:MAG: hypothetical protein AB7V58_15500 [Solirubrobacterales bacterium]